MTRHKWPLQRWTTKGHNADPNNVFKNIHTGIIRGCSVGSEGHNECAHHLQGKTLHEENVRKKQLALHFHRQGFRHQTIAALSRIKINCIGGWRGIRSLFMFPYRQISKILSNALNSRIRMLRMEKTSAHASILHFPCC